MTRMIFSEEGFWSLSHLIKSHKITGNLNNHKIEIYDIRYNDFGGRVTFGLISTRTIVRLDDTETSASFRILSAGEIDLILSQI